jgi:hypothetical protein
MPLGLGDTCGTQHENVGGATWGSCNPMAKRPLCWHHCSWRHINHRCHQRHALRPGRYGPCAASAEVAGLVAVAHARGCEDRVCQPYLYRGMSACLGSRHGPGSDRSGQDNCKTPVTAVYGANDNQTGPTCIQLEHAAMAYHNYFQYLQTWTEVVNNGSQNQWSTDLSSRPAGFALLNDNTTITAPWVEKNNTNATALFEKYGVIVNNVSLAMPHPGVISAAIDPINKIMQPAELDNLGVYNIKASVPSPVIHVLCATMNQTQLEPFIYALWPNHSDLTTAIWPAQLSNSETYQNNPYLNHTVFHDIFKWGTKYDEYGWPPIFKELPADYNTMVNDTGTGMAWGRDSIYILGKGGEVDSAGSPTGGQNYALCQLKVSQTPNCSTSYNASSSGGKLVALCEDENDEFRYIKSISNATSGNVSIARDWPNIASEWADSKRDRGETGGCKECVLTIQHRSCAQRRHTQSSCKWNQCPTPHRINTHIGPYLEPSVALHRGGSRSYGRMHSSPVSDGCAIRGVLEL